MNKKFEELFDLPASTPEQQEAAEDQPINNELVNTQTLAAIEKIESALPQVKGLESSDVEMDEIADLAKEAFNNLMDLGMQTDPRFSAEIFSVGSTMLGHVLTAKTAKIQKKLKMIDLQLKQAELERKLASTKEKEPDETPLGTGQVVDRNMLIKMILNNEATKNDSKDK